MQKCFRSPVRKVLETPYPRIGKALSGINLEAEDTKITTMAINITGRIIVVVLAITLKPNKFNIAVITIKISITISKSIFGK